MSNQFFSLMSLVSFAIGNQVYMFSLVYGLHWNRSIRRRSSALACTIMQLLHIGIIIIPHYPYDLGLYVWQFGGAHWAYAFGRHGSPCVTFSIL